MRIVKIDEAKDQFEELISRTEAGETILIEKDGKTIVKLEAMSIIAGEAKRTIDITELRDFTRKADINLRTPDALHLAIVEANGVTICTLDRKMHEAAIILEIDCLMP